MGIRSKINRVLLPYKLALKQEGGVSFKLKYLHYAKLAKRKGIVDFRIDRVAGEYAYDWFNVKGVSQEDKEWYCQRGYAPHKVNWVGLTKDNISDYISNFDFYNPTTYVDYKFIEFFENKLNTYFLLAPFKKDLPKHYWWVDSNGEVYPLDADSNKKGSYEDIVKLVKEKAIVAKACYGGHGKGFIRYESLGNGKYLINKDEVGEVEFIKSVKDLKNYLIQDFLRPCGELRKTIGEYAYGVIRIVTVNDPDDGPQFVASVIRIGCKGAGYLTDFPGTIYCGIDLETGSLFKPKMTIKENYESESCPNHPDTNAPLEGVRIPEWEYLRDLVIRVTSTIPWIKYVVMDVVPTDDGFKILEINSKGQTWVIEPHYPYLKNKYLKRAFGLISKQE